MSSIPPDPEIAAAIARAKRRRAMLERLSEIGMDLAEQIGAHAAASMAAINEDHGGDPGRAYAAVSRAVRLTLALETRTDEQIIALRNGTLPSLGRSRRAASGQATVEADAGSPVVAACPSRLRVRDEVREALYREVETPDAAQRVLDRLDSSLFGGDDWDDILYRPCRDTVAAIRADLGLAPDRPLWSDDAGFSQTAPCSKRPPGADPPPE